MRQRAAYCLPDTGDAPSELKAPRIPMATAIEQAANMVDRLHRIYVRTLRQLSDLRRHAAQVIVKNAGQVNVGNTQVNVNAGNAAGIGNAG